MGTLCPKCEIFYSDSFSDECPHRYILPMTNTATTKALTYDSGKAPLAWLPWAAIRGMSKVQQYGHAKYKDFNNYRKGMEVSRNLSCALRHIAEYLEGHNEDAESKCHPLEHAMCRIAFVLQNIHDGTAIDDRYRPASPAPVGDGADGVGASGGVCNPSSGEGC
jgi:hypothetical protein